MNEKCQNTAGSWEAETAENQNGRNDGKLMRLCVESVFEEYEDELTDPDDPQGEPQWVKLYGLGLHRTAEGHDIVPAHCLTGCLQTVRLGYSLGLQLQKALQAEPTKRVRGRYLADTFPVFVIGTPKFQDRMVILTKSCSFRCSSSIPSILSTTCLERAWM